MNGPELRDIHLPDGSLWWPPAPGWWLLLLLLILLVSVLPWLIRRARRRPLRRLSLRELDAIRAAHLDGAERRVTVSRLARLLRRTLISYRGRAGYGGSTGADWLRQMRELAPGGEFDARQFELLARERFRRDCEFDIDALLAAGETWIRALPRDGDHVSA